MFNFIKKKKIATAVKSVCLECIPVFKENMDNLYAELKSRNDMTDDEILEKLDLCTLCYNNAASDRLFNGLIENPAYRMLFLQVNHLPSVAGLPDTYTTDSLAKLGFDAAAIFATCYFMMTGKPVTEKDYRLMTELNEYQTALTDIIVANVVAQKN